MNANKKEEEEEEEESEQINSFRIVWILRRA
jgi:hypothetical protein